MDYFVVGSRPLLARFPPHIPGLYQQGKVQFAQDSNGQLVACPDSTVGSARGAGDGENPPSRAVGDDGVDSEAADVSEAKVPALSIPQGYDGKDHDCADREVGLGPPPSSPSRLGGAVATLGAVTLKAPAALHTSFSSTEVGTWDPARFQYVRKLQEAQRNRGQVHLMKDLVENEMVAVKQMPSRWVRSCHSEFVIEHPSETELPWQDVGCVRFLNNAGYPYGCHLHGVYRDDVHTYVVTSYAELGDLFSWCEAGVPPGRERENVVHPIARQILHGMQQLHDLSIVHRDLSLENILLSDPNGDDNLQIRLIDFSMASTSRYFRNCVRGKASYQAPELHCEGEYDAYLSDVFSLGVTLYALLLKDYPWLSTRPGGCKCFEYVRKHGFRSYLAKRKLRNSTARVAEFMSEPLQELLEGMLALDPADRLTLGESATFAQGNGRSVWELAWLAQGPPR